MITAYLQGGCANQFFIFAAAYAQAKRFDTELVLDVSSFDHDPMRRYTLGLFKGVNNRLVRSQPPPIITEEGLPYNQNLVNRITKNCTMRGYFQCFRYAERYRNDLVEIFKPGNELPEFSKRVERTILEEGERSVFITIRRTDYIGNDFHGVLPMSYYENAATLIALKLANPHFFVFSDDPKWCEDYFSVHFPYDHTISGNFDRTTKDHLGREDAELYLMSLCHHAIGANSSYSAMARWLSPYESEGLSIFPKAWFGPASKENPKDICKENWLRI